MASPLQARVGFRCLEEDSALLFRNLRSSQYFRILLRHDQPASSRADIRAQPSGPVRIDQIGFANLEIIAADTAYFRCRNAYLSHPNAFQTLLNLVYYISSLIATERSVPHINELDQM